MAITKSKRTAFTGAHLEPETKEVLEKIARKKNKSVSAFVSEAVEEKLERETTEPEPVPVVPEGTAEPVK